MGQNTKTVFALTNCEDVFASYAHEQTMLQHSVRWKQSIAENPNFTCMIL